MATAGVTKAQPTTGPQRRGRPRLQRKMLLSVLPPAMIRTGRVQCLTSTRSWSPREVQAMRGQSSASHPRPACCPNPPATGCPSQWALVTTGRWWPSSSKVSSRCRPERDTLTRLFKKKANTWTGTLLRASTHQEHLSAVILLTVFRLTSLRIRMHLQQCFAVNVYSRQIFFKPIFQKILQPCSLAGRWCL